MWLLAVLALSLEAGALWLLFRDVADMPTLAAFLVLRLAACAAASFFLSGTLPTRHRAQSRALFPFIFAICLLLPGLGVLGLGVAFGWTLRHLPPPERRVRHRLVAMPDAVVAHRRRPAWRRSVSGVLRGASSTADRTRALTRVKRLSGARATRLLRLAMKDACDDVRLLAYALLESRTNHADARVKSAQEALDAAAPDERAFWLERVAREQWELARAEYAEGDLRAFTLRSARKHLETALSLAPRGDLFVLQARVLLALNEPAAASAALDAAEQAGVPREELSIWLAEAAFKTRSFNEIGPLLALTPQRAAVSGPRAFWS